MQNKSIEETLGIKDNDYIGHERETVIRQRVDQNAFRAMILNNYNETCAITGIDDSRLLIASHIIPWSEREDTRLNPSNGICLSALFDKAFDKGLMTIRPDDYTVMFSPELKERMSVGTFVEHFLRYENKRIMLPEEHIPDAAFLEYHAENVFIK